MWAGAEVEVPGSVDYSEAAGSGSREDAVPVVVLAFLEGGVGSVGVGGAVAVAVAGVPGPAVVSGCQACSVVAVESFGAAGVAADSFLWAAGVWLAELVAAVSSVGVEAGGLAWVCSLWFE